MSTTLSEMVRSQILAEGPDLEGPTACDRYIDETLSMMSNLELLERISDALQEAATRYAVRPWL